MTSKKIMGGGQGAPGGKRAQGWQQGMAHY
jgi:hypothetical protein